MTPLQQEVLNVIDDWQKRYRNSPNPREIALTIKRHRSSVEKALHGLQRKGYIYLEKVFYRVMIVRTERV